MAEYTDDYLLNRQVKILQSADGYRASIDAVMLSAMVRKVNNSERILDIGSGTGAISLCLAHRFPQAEITGLEIQPELVRLSNLSAEANGFQNLKFINCDIRRQPKHLFCQYHHVVTNPPYADNDMPSPNPSKSCAHNFQNFSLDEWLATALKCLRPKGILYTVNRAEAADAVLATVHGKLGDIRLVPIYSKNGQNAKRVLICGSKNSRGPMRISSGLTVHNDDGTYTEAVQKILRDGCCLFD